MLRTLAADAARRFGARVAFSGISMPNGDAAYPYPGRAIWDLSFADLDRLSDEVAASLAARGVLPGDVVALVLPPVPEFPVCYLGAAKIGAITAGLDPRWQPARIERLLDLLQPAVSIAFVPGGAKGANDGSGGAATVGAAPNGPLVAITPASRTETALTGLRRDALPPPPLPPDPVRPALIAFTSGVTRAPRGAVFGEPQLLAIAAAETGDGWGTGRRRRVLTAVSLARYAFMTRLPAILRAGISCFLMPSWDPAQALLLAAELQATHLFGLPSQLAKLVEGGAGPGAAPPGLPELRAIVIGGAAVPPGLGRALRDRFRVRVDVRYGCAEAGLGLSTCHDERARDIDGCVGRPAPGVTLALRDADGHPVADGEVGHVLLRSDASMTGYWNDADASMAAFTMDRFVRTGDAGRLDEDGRLVLTGRSRTRE
jgi:acyl-CoA synthetase (AMP-forming)/AMP-acid ligase II